MISKNRIGLCLAFLALTQATGPESGPDATTPSASYSQSKALATGAQAASASSQAGETVSCRVLETWSVKKLGVAMAIFHQARKEDGPKLGEMLLQRDGATAEFQTPDGQWYAATVFRVKTCFGRGMLVFPAASASLTAHEVIPIRFVVQKGSL